MNLLRKIIACLALFVLGAGSLYMGIGGAIKAENRNHLKDKFNFEDTRQVIISGISYANYAEYKLHEENAKALRLFPFLNLFPEYLDMILTACSFGMLGGVILLIRNIALDGIKPEDTRFISIPLLGFFTGIINLGLIYLLPTILTENKIQIRPITLEFLSLFAGIFSAYFFDFLTSQVRTKIYKNEK